MNAQAVTQILSFHWMKLDIQELVCVSEVISLIWVVSKGLYSEI